MAVAKITKQEKTVDSTELERARMTAWLRERVASSQKAVHTEVVTLTPVLAELLLAQNESNRKINDRVVGTYCRDMMAGRWTMNGEPLIVAKDGKLNDGQHRCLAVVQGDVAVPVVMVFGVARETRFTVDQGAMRTAGDYLGMNGFVQPGFTATVAQYIWQYKEREQLNTGSGGGYNRATKTEVLLVAQSYGSQILDSIHVVTRDGVRLIGGITLLAFCHWAIARVVGEADAAEFIRQAIDGNDLAKNDPVFLLRKRLLGAKDARLSINEKAELVFRAWNARRLGETPTHFKIVNGKLPKLEK